MKVVSVEPLEEQAMIDLQTTTGTFIAEGLVLHNTTISLLIDVVWMALHKNIIGCLVTDDEKKREANRALLVKYVESFPDGYFGDSFRLVKNNRAMLQFSNGARLHLLVAGTKKKAISWGEGIGYTFAHLCMPGTPVITEHGRIKAIEDVVIGDRVITHTGASATVVDVLGQPNSKGPMLRITPWLGQSYCSEGILSLQSAGLSRRKIC